jgi:2'-5' RNA ligase
MTRLFVAVEIPKSLSDDISTVQSTIKSGVKTSAQITLVDPLLMHITLKFIGEVDENKVQEIKVALCSISFSPFSIKVKHTQLNSKKQPRVLWLSLHSSPPLLELATKIEQVLIPFGIETEKRDYNPHITIARIKRSSPELISTALSVQDSIKCTFPVTGFVLKKSVLTPSGPIYSDIHVY